MWGGAVRYQKEWGELFEVGAGMGYEKTSDERLLAGGGGLNNFKRDIQDWAGSASIEHKPTGLFVVALGAPPTTTIPIRCTPASSRGPAILCTMRGILSSVSSAACRGSASIRLATRPCGARLPRRMTVSARAPISDVSPRIALPAGTFANVGVDTEITGAQVDRWGIAFDQAIDSAMMHLYVVYQHLTPEVDLVDLSLNGVNAPLDNFDLGDTGARIYF